MATQPVLFDNPAGCCASINLSVTKIREKLHNSNPVDPCVDVVAQRLNELSVKEREAISEEIHGVSEKQEEDPTFVDRHLQLLDEELNLSRSSNNNKSCRIYENRFAYDLAKSMDSKYVSRREFLLSFLRADEFNIHNTTTRIIRHFHTKLNLFGKDKLVKDITFDDLSPDDQESVMAGSHQFTGLKDVRGRTIFFVFPQLITGASIENFLRAQWYTYNVGAEDECIQKYGVIVVVMGRHSAKSISWALKNQDTVVQSVALRPLAMHACYIDRNSPMYVKHMLNALGKNFQSRFRFHLNDSSISNLYALQSFGINPLTVPLQHDGSPCMKRFLKVVEERKAFERKRNNNKYDLFLPTITSMATSDEIISSNNDKNNTNEKTRTTKLADPEITTSSSSSSSSSSSFDIVPTSRDVLLGRGLKHPGNSALDDIIDNELSSHQNAVSTFDKTCIVLATVRRIQKSGGRFLKRDSTSKQWIVVTDNTARETVSCRFRKRTKVRALPPTQNNKYLSSPGIDHKMKLQLY